MKIYIPTRSRFTTAELSRGPLALMSKEWVDNTYLVTPFDQQMYYLDSVAELKADKIIKGTPHIIGWSYDGIAEKRTMIGAHAESMKHKKFMMLDDDINFLKRVSPDRVNQTTIRDSRDIDVMLSSVSNHLCLYPQVAVGLREGNNHAGPGPAPLVSEVGKAIRAVAYRTEVYRAVETNRVRTMSDYDTTLQILELGYKNAVLNFWMSGQKGTNTPGGCADWRTHAVHEESIQRMVEMHGADICKPRQKANKGGGEFGHRMELTIFWKKAYEKGVKKYGAKN